MATLRSSLITSRAELETAFREIAQYPYGYMLIAREPTRTDEQNRLMWPLLKEFERQGDIQGRTFRDFQWKSIAMEALGHEQEFLPSMDGSRWFPAGLRTSKLSKQEFSDLIELLYAEAAKRGIVLKREVENGPA
tara:strand:- start:895 stop:1299 length:405 start_codon:yes stop_codon:yes gene_type:complete